MEHPPSLWSADGAYPGLEGLGEAKQPGEMMTGD